MHKNQSIRILVVDDMPSMRKILCNSLAEAGFTAVAAVEDGELAWNLIQEKALEPEQAFELIIADWSMPEFSGIELLRAVRNFGPTQTIPFLMVTAKVDHKNVAEALSIGVSDYIVKPFSGAQVIEKINALFSHE